MSIFEENCGQSVVRGLTHREVSALDNEVFDHSMENHILVVQWLSCGFPQTLLPFKTKYN